jgi:hypothetical protein
MRQLASRLKRAECVSHLRLRVPKKVFGVGTLLVTRSIRMLDLILLALGLGFFALAIGYTIACDRL